MRKLVSLLVVSAVFCGGWYFLQTFEIQGLDRISLGSRGADASRR